MLRVAIATVALALALPAQAQMTVLPCCNLWQVQRDEAVARRQTGDLALDRAVTICEQHKIVSSTFYPEGGAPRAFADGWQSCHGVMDAWNKSETAYRLREEAAQEQRDKEFIDAFAKSLAEKNP